MDQKPFQDYYADLRLESEASHKDIKAAYHALALKHHPDKTGTSDSSIFRAAQEAYEKLTDAVYRREYDRIYRERKSQANSTSSQAAEMQEQARRASPPPKKPLRKFGEPSWKYFNSPQFQKWQRETEEYYARHPECDTAVPKSKPSNPHSSALARGLAVNISHTCALQNCSHPTYLCSVQPGGPDHCVFCGEAHIGCKRCPVCQALACYKCLNKIVALERKSSGGFGSGGQYTASGG